MAIKLRRRERITAILWAAIVSLLIGVVFAAIPGWREKNASLNVSSSEFFRRLPVGCTISALVIFWGLISYYRRKPRLRSVCSRCQTVSDTAPGWLCKCGETSLDLVDVRWVDDEK